MKGAAAPRSRQVLSWAAHRYKDQSAEGVWQPGLRVFEALGHDWFVEISPTDHLKYKVVDREKQSIVCSSSEEERAL
jgi:hypothetical protein